MDRGLILLLAASMVFVAPAVQGTAHLSFANDTQVNITRAGCGTTKLCVETPDDCDPAGNSTSCLFGSIDVISTMAPNGSHLSIELRGHSMGYIAMGLTANASEGITMLFICAQNSSDNGTFFFRTMQRNNTNHELTATETTVTEIRGVVSDNVIHCEFDVPSVNATMTRDSQATTFSVLLGAGSVNGDTVGPFNVTLNSGPLNVANPASNVPTAAPSTTMPSTTTGSSGVVQPHAVLLLLSVLSLFAMLKA